MKIKKMNAYVIGDNLKKLRKGKKYSQEELAEILDVSSKTVSRWENGVSFPKKEIWNQLSQIFEVPIYEMLSGSFHDAESLKREDGVQINVKGKNCKFCRLPGLDFTIHMSIAKIIMAKGYHISALYVNGVDVELTSEDEMPAFNLLMCDIMSSLSHVIKSLDMHKNAVVEMELMKEAIGIHAAYTIFESEEIRELDKKMFERKMEEEDFAYMNQLYLEEEQESYIESIRKVGNYYVDFLDLQEFFPIIEFSFAKVLGIAAGLKKQGFNVTAIGTRFFEVHLETNEEVEKFAPSIMSLADEYMHTDDTEAKEVQEQIDELEQKLIDEYANKLGIPQLFMDDEES